jgi:hypothetical protein
MFQEYVDMQGPLSDNPTLPNPDRSRERQGPEGRWHCQQRWKSIAQRGRSLV